MAGLEPIIIKFKDIYEEQLNTPRHGINRFNVADDHE